MAKIELEFDIDKATEDAIELLKTRFQSACGVPLEDVQKIVNGDLVSVVRCRDCTFSSAMTDAEAQRYKHGCIMCRRLHPQGQRLPMLADGYCVYGMYNTTN